MSASAASADGARNSGNGPDGARSSPSSVCTMGSPRTSLTSAGRIVRCSSSCSSPTQRSAARGPRSPHAHGSSWRAPSPPGHVSAWPLLPPPPLAAPSGLLQCERHSSSSTIENGRHPSRTSARRPRPAIVAALTNCLPVLRRSHSLLTTAGDTTCTPSWPGSVDEVCISRSIASRGASRAPPSASSSGSSSNVTSKSGRQKGSRHSSGSGSHDETRWARWLPERTARSSANFAASRSARFHSESKCSACREETSAQSAWITKGRPAVHTGSHA
eukprot:3406439-Prymnesium_polylepis.2